MKSIKRKLVTKKNLLTSLKKNNLLRNKSTNPRDWKKKDLVVIYNFFIGNNN